MYITIFIVKLKKNLMKEETKCKAHFFCTQMQIYVYSRPFPLLKFYNCRNSKLITCNT